MNQKDLDAWLMQLSDEKYKKFHTKLGVPRVLGVRIPNLDKVAKQLVKEGKAIDYLNDYVSMHYEGDVIYGMLIGYAKMDEDLRKKYIFDFCKIIDNWASCDLALARWKFIKKNPEVYLDLVAQLLATKKEWYCRVSYVILLYYYLNDSFYPEVIKRLNIEIHSAYYTQMAAAWLISMGLVKYPDAFEKWMSFANLEPFVFQKALQKAIESRQLSDKKKEEYREMKQKQLIVE